MTAHSLNINDIYDKNINFLIGSGASYGLFPTLSLGIKDDDGNSQTIETLATLFEKEKGSNSLYTQLFMHYYKECIEPAMTMEPLLIDLLGLDKDKPEVIQNYQAFIETVVTILQRRKRLERRCNIFTTNYDSCFEYAAEQIFNEGGVEFILNDGAIGFRRRFLQARNFNNFTCRTGVFDRYKNDLPQINLIHLHGSIYWYKDGENILVNYSSDDYEKRLIKNVSFDKVSQFSNTLSANDKKISDLPNTPLRKEEEDEFWEKYNDLPIVNPTKWKFHETVFEEHYYQMLRLLSYELEKPNSVFITFGFSFADEHILNLIKRSLSNPTLQLFICCFNQEEAERIQAHFKHHRNVEYITSLNDLNFAEFNNNIFTTAPKTEEAVITSDEVK